MASKGRSFREPRPRPAWRIRRLVGEALRARLASPRSGCPTRSLPRRPVALRASPSWAAGATDGGEGLGRVRSVGRVPLPRPRRVRGSRPSPRRVVSVTGCCRRYPFLSVAMVINVLARRALGSAKVSELESVWNSLIKVMAFGHGEWSKGDSTKACNATTLPRGSYSCKHKWMHERNIPTQISWLDVVGMNSSWTCQYSLLHRILQTGWLTC